VYTYDDTSTFSLYRRIETTMWFNFQAMKCPRRTVWNHLSSDAKRNPQRLRKENLNTLITAISLSLFFWISFFGSVLFFCNCLSYTTLHSTTLFTFSSLSSTQPYFPLLVDPLPNGFPLSSSTRVTTGPVTYSTDWITFAGQLYTNTRCFLTPHISPAVRLPFVPTVIPTCSCPLGFSQPDLKPHPLLSLSCVTCTIKLQKSLFILESTLIVVTI